MKRNDWLIFLVPLVGVWLLDYSTKMWVESLNAPLSVGFFQINKLHSIGRIFSYYADLPTNLRRLTLYTIAIFLLLAYTVSQYLWPIKSHSLRIGLSLLLGGFTANIYDRINWGYVLHFLTLDISNLRFAVNLADLAQWIGGFLIAHRLIVDREIFWPKSANYRKRLWINHDYQLRYILFLLSIGVSFSLLTGFFSYSYLGLSLKDKSQIADLSTDQFLIPFLLTYAAISTIFCGCLIFIGRKKSHHSAGPIYAFDKYVADLLEGRNRRFVLRADDEFKLLEVTGQKLAEYLSENGLIDSEDDVKVLTTHHQQAGDFSLGAVPVEGQAPDYSNKSFGLQQALRTNASRVRPDCPLCLRKSYIHHQHPISPQLVECVYCHFVFDPLPAPSNVTSLDEQKAHLSLTPSLAKDDQWTHSAKLFTGRRTFAKILEKVSGIGSLLDIGSGNGEIPRLAKEQKIKVVHGLETLRSDQALTETEDILIFTPRDLMVKNPSDGYDVITAIETLHRSKEPVVLISMCHQLLKNEGHIVIVTSDVNSWWARWMASTWIPAAYQPQCLFSGETLTKLLQENGFSIVSLDRPIAFVTMGSLFLRLKNRGHSWAQVFLDYLPERLLGRLIIPIPMRQLRAIAKKKASASIETTKQQASNL